MKSANHADIQTNLKAPLPSDGTSCLFRTFLALSKNPHFSFSWAKEDPLQDNSGPGAFKDLQRLWRSEVRDPSWASQRFSLGIGSMCVAGYILRFMVCE